VVLLKELAALLAVPTLEASTATADTSARTVPERPKRDKPTPGADRRTRSRLASTIARIKAWLPRGGELPAAAWDMRHQRIVTLTYFVAAACVAFSFLREGPEMHVFGDVTLIVGPAVLAGHAASSRTTKSAMAALGLLNACSVLIHLAGGVTEAHFAFFVVIGILTMYQDWVPFLLAISYVVIHHGVMGTLMPREVFDHASAWNDPWTWAAIHGAFVLAASVTYVMAWKMNEHYKTAADASSALLEASEERFRALVQRSSDVTMVCDGDGVLSYVSAASLAVLGIDDQATVGRTVTELIHPDDRERLAAYIAEVHASDTETLECRISSENRSVRWVEITITDLREDPAVAGIVLHVRDITDRHHLEADLRHSQKLESVGQLAAGIAHEINTPLQFVGDNVMFLRDAFQGQTRVLSAYRDAPQSAAVMESAGLVEKETDFDFLVEEVPSAIEQTIDGLDRVMTIVRAMKAFGHPNSDTKSPADLNEGIRNTLVVANSTLKSAAEIRTEFGDLPPVLCHVGDINQVILNIVVNAAHAIADAAVDGKLGLITVRTFCDGDDAVIEVSDSGPGIAPEIADRIFDPFYTTKDVGSGTGQGLAISYALVHDRHGGSIKYTSDLGVGTTFVIRLPIGAASAR
jgi:PAS domain S-box-containing protein